MIKIQIRFFTNLLPFILICLAFSLIKFWLIQDNEIYARHEPHDQLWFVEAAGNLLKHEWLGGYGKLTLIRPPAYPFWMYLVNITGIRLRVGTELLLLISSLLLTISLIRARVPWWLACAIFASIIFHPATVIMNDETHSESVYLPFLLLSLSGLIFVSLAPEGPKKLLLAILTGIFLGLLWNTREETPLIVFFLIVFWISQTLTERSKGHHWSLALKKAAIPFLIFFVVILSFTAWIKMMNQQKYGLFVVTELHAPGFIAANKALSQIESDRSIRFTPVPQDVRAKVYFHSPAFAALKPYLENYKETDWYKWICKYHSACEDIAGWFIWQLRDSVSLAGHYRDAKETDRYYQEIANEINLACEEGKLKCKGGQVFHSFLNLNPNRYIPYLWKSFKKTMTIFWQSFSFKAEPETEIGIPPDTRELLNRVANRRADLIRLDQFHPNDSLEIRGWALGFTDPVVKTRLLDSAGKSISENVLFLERPDVQEFFLQQNIAAPLHSGFRIRSDAPANFTNSKLEISTQSGKLIEIPIIKSGATDNSIAYFIDEIIPVNGKSTIQNKAGTIYAIMIWTLSALTFAGSFFVLFFGEKKNTISAIPRILILVGVIIFSRIALISFLDAGVWPVHEYVVFRYLYPILPLFACFLWLTLYMIFSSALPRGNKVRPCSFSPTK